MATIINEKSRLVCDFSSAPPVDIDSAQGLEYLSLAGCSEWVTDDVVIKLSRGGRLRRVQLFRCWRVTDKAIRKLVMENGSNLEVLELAGCSGVTDKALRSIGKFCRRLESLDLTRCPNITDVGINYIDSIPLNTLLLYADSQLGRSAYTCIGHSMQSLVHLDLCGHSNLHTDTLVGILRSCPLLEVLNLSWCVELDDKFVSSILGDRLLRNIKSLSLFGIRNLSSNALMGLLKYFKGTLSLHALDVRAIPSVACLTDNDCLELRGSLPQLTSWKLHT